METPIYISNRCVENIDKYHSWIFIVLDDDTLISECSVKKRNKEEIYYDLNSISNNGLIREDTRYEGFFLIQFCSTWKPKHAIRNNIYGNVMFTGGVFMSKYDPCQIYKQSVNFIVYQTPAWNNYIFYSNFSIHSYQNDYSAWPGSFADQSSVNYFYQWSSVYKMKENSFIVIKFNNFDLDSLILNQHGKWDYHYIVKPSSIDASRYPDINVNSITFEDPLFLLTGFFKFQDIQILFAATYLDEAPSSGKIMSYPNPVPINCNKNNCKFEGFNITKLKSSGFIVSGSSLFANSKSKEWLQLNLDLNLQLISYIRRSNSGELIATKSLTMSDGNTIIVGNDKRSMALVQFSFTLETINEERFAIEDSLLIHSITSFSSDKFFVSGCVNPYGDTSKYSIIIQISDKFHIIKHLIFPFLSEIQEIIYSKIFKIFGVLNYPDSSNSFCNSQFFRISSDLNLETFSSKILLHINLYGIAEIRSGIFALVGSANRKFFIGVFDQYLNTKITSISKTRLPQQLSFNILLKSVIGTSFGNIIAGGSIQIGDNEDCLIMIYNESLNIMNYSIFGTIDSDGINQVVSASDSNIIATGYQSNRGFIRVYSASMKHIKEQLFSEEEVVLNTISEFSFEKFIVSGFNFFNHYLVTYELKLSLICDQGFKYDPKDGFCYEIC